MQRLQKEKQTGGQTVKDVPESMGIVFFTVLIAKGPREPDPQPLLIFLEGVCVLGRAWTWDLQLALTSVSLAARTCSIPPPYSPVLGQGHTLAAHS